MLPAGVHIAVVSKRLGHSTSALTSDAYSHMLRGAAGMLPSALLPSCLGRQSRHWIVCDQSVTRGALETTEGPRLNDEGPEIIGAPVGTAFQP